MSIIISPVVTIKNGIKNENQTKTKIWVRSVVKEDIGDMEKRKR